MSNYSRQIADKSLKLRQLGAKIKSTAQFAADKEANMDGERRHIERLQLEIAQYTTKRSLAAVDDNNNADTGDDAAAAAANQKTDAVKS